jgi:hypothetical protein
MYMNIVGINMYENKICKFVTMDHYYNYHNFELYLSSFSYLKRYVSEIGFYLRLQVEHTQIGFNSKS